MISKVFVYITLLAVAFSEGKYCSSEGPWVQTKTFEEARVECDAGYLSRMCMGDMQWGRINDHDCMCTPSEDVPVLVNVKRGETIEHQCDRGFIEITCNITGTWDMDNIISNDCRCAKKDGFPMTSTDQYSSKKCTVGSVERFCNFGKWDEPNYEDCFNYEKTESCQSVTFSIFPHKMNRAVSTCILPVLRTDKRTYTIDDIMTKGTCINQECVSPFEFQLELEPNDYRLLIYADDDGSFVPIPALVGLRQNNYYVYEFSTADCQRNDIAFFSSTSYSLTLTHTYNWGSSAAPKIVVYYSDNLKLSLKDLSQFSRQTFTGETGFVQHQLVITGLKPYTKYRFYARLTDSTGVTKTHTSEPTMGRTYDICHQTETEDWPEVGVGEESIANCTIGQHTVQCTKDRNYLAKWANRNDDFCYCPMQIIDGVTYYPTPYGHYDNVTNQRYCGWRGVWEYIPGDYSCTGDDHWETTEDGDFATIICDNGGSLVRYCTSGVWGEVINRNCFCRYQETDGVQWPSLNPSSNYKQDCMIGALQRTCNAYGQWEEPEDLDCRCAAEGIWDEAAFNTVQKKPCGTDGKEDNFVTRECLGYWAEENVDSCYCDPVTENLIAWEMTQVGATNKHVCGFGYKVRWCNNYGQWDTNVMDYSCMCRQNDIWESVPADSQVALSCPDNAEDKQYRYCNNAGSWETIQSTECYGSCPAEGNFPVTLAGTVASATCPGGKGRVYMTCMQKLDANNRFYGEWDYTSYRVEGECMCEQNDEFESVEVGEESVIECDMGSRSKRCNPYTFEWEATKNNNCMCSFGEESPITAALDETTSLACQIGSRSVKCGVLGHYENVDDSECFCAADDAMNQTHAGETGSHACAEYGSYSRTCGESGFWEEADYSECQCTGVPEITDYLMIGETVTKNCPVGSYVVKCSLTGSTMITTNDCACAETDYFPVTPAGQVFNKDFGTCADHGECGIDGEWNEDASNVCMCTETDLFPSIHYNSTADALLPWCYFGFCNSTTQTTEINYDGCGCAADGEWPALAHDQSMTLTCSTGGSRTATCHYGVLTVSFDGCECVNDETNYAVGDYLSTPCMIGMNLQQCRGNNVWHEVEDAFCGCSSKEDGLSIFEIVAANSWGVATCGSGSMKIFCDATGHYDLTTLENSCGCPADGVWPATAHDQTATIDCSSPYMATAQRHCNSYGVWEEPESQCQCPMDGEWFASAPGMHDVECTATGVTIHRECGVNGVWAAATGSCLDESCPAEDGIWERTAHLGTAVHTCGNGKKVTRSCNAGVWSTPDWTDCGCEPEDGYECAASIDADTTNCWSTKECVGGGMKKRQCLYGVWQDVDYDDCHCAAEQGFPQTPANQHLTQTCLTGSVDVFCNTNGEWEILESSCGCEEDSTTMEGVTFPASMVGQTVSVPCSEGSMTRICSLGGVWSSVDFSACKCAANNWTTVSPGEYSEQQCQEGHMTRFCKPNGQWGFITSHSCACSADGVYESAVIDATTTTQCDIGSVTGRCTMDGFVEVENNDCACAAADGYEETSRNATASTSCGTYKDGMKYRRCGLNGHWEQTEDTSDCVNWCSAIGQWPATRPNTTVHLSCPEGYSDGDIQRYCNDKGIWEVGTSTCAPLRCEATNGFPTTNIFNVAEKSCEDGYLGSYKRSCNLENGNAVWGAIERNCEVAVCTVGDRTYQHNEEMTVQCPAGHVGMMHQVCKNGEWIISENTCETLVCPADEENGYPEAPYGTVYRKNCGVDYNGVIVMRCNGKKEWEYVEGSCTAIEPSLRCIPYDGMTEVALTPLAGSQYTVYCTSNVRIAEVINDQAENMNIHILFDLPDAVLSYPTRAVRVSDYTIGFAFDGSFPPACEGILFVLEKSFVAATGVAFPASTMAQSFATKSGQPLAPLPVKESDVSVASVNYEQRTVSLQIEVPFSASLYDEAQIMFPASGLQAIRFSQNTVVVEDVLINGVLAMVWRVRKGEFWSEFSAVTAYRPVVVLPPSVPVVESFHAGAVRYVWSADLLMDGYNEYQYQVFSGEEKVTEGRVAEAAVDLELPTDATYTCRVAVCSAEECSAYSAFSEPITLSATVSSPSAPESLTAMPSSSTSFTLSWSQPASLGGASVQKYVIRRASDAAMTQLIDVAETSALSYEMSNVQESSYVSVAAYNGLLSVAATVTLVPVELTAIWHTNEEEEVLYDGEIIVFGQFNYLAIAQCTLTCDSVPAVTSTVSFQSSVSVEHVFSGLVAGASYTIVCSVHEPGQENTVTSTLTASTASTSALSHAVLVSAEARASQTALVTVRADMLGSVTCFVAPFNSAADRPTSNVSFESQWAQTGSLEHLDATVEFLFAYDVNGNLLAAEQTYHAWCLVQHTVLSVDGDELREEIIYYPDYTATTVSGASVRKAQQAETFEITSISPAEFAVDVDPSADIIINFSMAAAVGEGNVVLLSEEGKRSMISKNDIVCSGSRCVVGLRSALKPQHRYVLTIDEDAFMHEEMKLENGVDNYFFMTSYHRCDTKFVSKGLSDTRMCQCFSVKDTCECECGETSVMREM